MDFASIYTRFRSQSALKTFKQQVRKIAELEISVAGLSDTELRDRFQALSAEPEPKRVLMGFALARESAKRAVGMRPFDVQLIGGLALLQGKLAEMRTGEGKTLAIVAPAACLALLGHGVHVVTANSYLARRDAELMRPVYETLGLTVAYIDSDLSAEEKRAAYAANVTYGVGFEFGFDYLRDNLVQRVEDRVQRGLSVAIVDEVDSILIDEARTPLIISGSGAMHEAEMRGIDTVTKSLTAGKDYAVDPKERTAFLTELGYERAEAGLASAGLIDGSSDLYAAANLHLLRRLHAAVKAYGVYRKDRDYVVQGGEVILVDQGTGRKMPGRRLEDGLHEAIEAKEGVRINAGTVTRATITYQNFFGLYDHLSGLTGTALTEADEFAEFYHLETVVIPTNRPIARKLNDDLVYLTKAAKFSAAVEEVVRRQKSGQPVLVGCASVRDAEVLSQLFARQSIVHEVLTAKHLDREAHIIANAGRPGAITVATNMAGRGTDILLGGEKPQVHAFDTEVSYQEALAAWAKCREAVLAAGGLYVLGTERSGIRRVDNQLVGRAGRQGDPGEVQFYLSMEDELLRVFGQSRQLAMVTKMLEKSGGVLGGRTVASMVAAAQRRIEGQGFDARRTLMKFDSVLASQRSAIFALRNDLLAGQVDDYCEMALYEAVQAWADAHLDAQAFPEQWDLATAKRALREALGVDVGLVGWVHTEELEHGAIIERVREAVFTQYQAKPRTAPEKTALVFRALTELWTEHLTSLEELRQSMSLRSTSGNPVYQYSKDAFELFKMFERALSQEVARQLMQTEPAVTLAPAPRTPQDPVSHGEARVAMELDKRWVRRNEDCPCGSGLKFRACHGKLN